MNQTAKDNIPCLFNGSKPCSLVRTPLRLARRLNSPSFGLLCGQENPILLLSLADFITSTLVHSILSKDLPGTFQEGCVKPTDRGPQELTSQNPLPNQSASFVLQLGFFLSEILTVPP